MTELLFWIFSIIAAFGTGYYVAGHETDTRAFLQRVRDALGRLIHRE